MAGTGFIQWHEIPRQEIDWHPTVVTDRCVGDGICVTSCGRGVFAFDYEANIPVVVSPDQCMVGCTTCATLCLTDAIEFPSRGYVRSLIRRYKIARESKDRLQADPEKFGIARKHGPESS